MYKLTFYFWKGIVIMSLGQYTRIERVKFKDGVETYFLTYDGAAEELFEVDIKSDFYHNEFSSYDIEERSLVKNVTSLSEVIEFCKEHNISLNNRFEASVGLYTGGAADMLVKSDLTHEWVN